VVSGFFIIVERLSVHNHLDSHRFTTCNSDNVINCNFVVLPVINMVMTDNYRYCNSLTRYSRFSTVVVPVGDVPLGGTHSIRIQSMTTTNSLDTKATVDQVIRMADAGCDYVRITSQGVREAENLAVIKKELATAGYRVPIIADVHFNPRVAEMAARLVEKVRINPGNYADKPRGIAVYDETEYLQGLEKVREKLYPLISICKQYGTALRIGGNHGSLSERIMSRYGNSPEGLVESVLEYARICHGEGFHSLVLSVKSSNTRVMVQACRLLVHRMMEEGMNYPVHLGVTEAGGGMDGRIKSAVGIGALLEDGIGDTIRVSLTEDPELEVPAARKMIDRYKDRHSHPAIHDMDSLPYDPFNYKKRETRAVGPVGGKQVPVIFSEIESEGSVLTKEDFLSGKKAAGGLSFIAVTSDDLEPRFIETIKNDGGAVLVFETANPHGMAEQRRMFCELMRHDCRTPVIIKRSYPVSDRETLMLHSATDIGSLLVDGLGDGIWIELLPSEDKVFLNDLSLGILQASRTRFSRADFIACPSCGRTLFDIQKTLQVIRVRTGHLKNLTIGVMGCIVNGPGEMADADYGYVGSGPGKITLYKGKQVIRKNVPEEEAVDALVNLIRENGDWVD